MSKLLSTELYKIREKILLFIPIMIGFGVAMAFCAISNSNTIYIGVSRFVFIFGVILCGITGMLISQDFAYNTIRNKLIIGHTRLNIYLSYQIIFAVFIFLMTVIFMTAYIVSGNLFSYMEVFQINQPAPDILQIYRENFFKALPVYFIAMPALTTLSVFISVTLKNSTSGVVTIILADALSLFPALNEFFPENKFIEYINQILPSSQIYLIESFSAQSDFSPVKYILFSLVFAVAMIALGYALFRKADLK